MTIYVMSISVHYHFCGWDGCDAYAWIHSDKPLITTDIPRARSSVKRAVAQLKKRGYEPKIEIEKFGKSNAYFITIRLTDIPGESCQLYSCRNYAKFLKNTERLIE